MELTITTFQRVAIIVTFVLYTLAVVGVAVYARRQKSSVNSYVDDFYTGGRGMGMLAVAFMIAAGLCGAGTFVGSPGMSYRVGGPWLMINGCQLFVTFVVLGEIGKKIGIVCNLAPRPMMKGKYVSEGMIFAADTADGGCSIPFYSDDTPVGARIH